MKVLTGRGNELTRDSFRDVWDRQGSGLESVQVLLPDPDAGAGSWLAARETELERLDSGFSDGLLAEQLSANITYLVKATEGDARCEVRLLDFPQACRLVITDRLLYLTVYQAHAHGRNSPCLVFAAGSDMYAYGM